MWEDMDSRKKSKGQRLFSNGVVVLVCLILAAQAVFFGKYLIDGRRAMREGQRQEELQAPQTEKVPAPQDNAIGRESPSAKEVASVQEGPAVHPSPARAVSSSDNHPSEQTFSPVPATTSTPAADSSPHTDSPRDSRATNHSPTLSYPHDGWSWDRVELNSADSAALDALPGIGPYYARQILAYRERLGFYADISQLLDIRGMDTARLRRLADRLYIAPESLRPLDLYTMPLDSLAAHPGHPRQPHPPAGTGPPARAVLPGDRSTVSRSAPHFHKYLIIRDTSTCQVLFVASAMPMRHTHLR